VNPKTQAHLDVAAITHEGMSGKNNEDHYSVSAYTLSEDVDTPAVFAIVADGIGGHLAGEIAAEIAVETISSAVADGDSSNPVATLRDAIVLASQQIHSQAKQRETTRGMGSTCACAWIIKDQLYTAAVGDSRIYTWIQEALTYGIIKPEQVKGHPQAHVIRRYLGSQKPPEVDFRLRLHADDDDQRALQNQGSKLLPADRLILCSDGLTDLVSDDEIKQIMTDFDAETALEHLVDLANQRGGHDNITIVTLQIPEDNSAPQTKKTLRTPLYWLAGIGLGILTIAVLAALAFFSWRLTRPEATITPTPTSSATPMVEIFTPSPGTVDITPSAPAIPTITMEVQSVQASYTPWPTSTSTTP